MSFTFRPRPDRGSPPHDRAAVLIAERIDTRLEPEEAAWLEAHLANCRSCRALADAYASDRLELQALGRRDPIEPPRDLWARTAAALDREAAGGQREQRRPRRRPSPAPVGAAAGLLVVAVVVGASILSGRPLPSPVPPSQAPSSPPLVAVSVEPTATVPATPGPTPLSIPSGDVPYLAADDDGNQALFTVNVSEVCSANGAACAPIAASSPRAIDLPDTPHAVILSPNDEQLVVVDAGATGDGGTVLVVPVPTDGGAPTATPSPTPPPTATPQPTSAPPTTCPPPVSPMCEPPSTSAPPTSAPPTGSPGVSATPPPPTSAPPPASPSPTVTASVSPSITTSPSPTVSVEPSPTASVSVSVSPEPPSPTPSAAETAVATPLAIAEDVVVDSETAAFSPDGRLLAFSARPADGSHGPDIYLWPTDGTGDAVPLTSDHRSVFAGWLDDLILGSRVADDATAEGAPSASTEPPASAEPSASVAAEISAPAAVEHRGEAFLLDPATGEVTLVVGRSLWRPSVDPTQARAVYWDGTIERDDEGGWRAAAGRLVLGPWGAAVSDASPASSDDAGIDVLAEGPLVDWDAQWDATGTHLAIWIADPDDPEIGKLSLYVVDPETGRLNADLAPLRDERALPGFAISDNRLVWATPPGQNGEASHVRVLAWTADGVGTAETPPAEEIVVIR